MVINDIQNNLQAALVKARHHLFELSQRLFAFESIASIRRKKGDAVITPVVSKPLFQEMTVVDKGMNRQQFDRGDSERSNIIDDFLLPQSGKGASQLVFYFRELFSEPANVHFVDDGVIPWNPLLAARLGPLKTRINNYTLGHKRRTIPFVESQIVHRFHLVSEERGVPG